MNPKLSRLINSVTFKDENFKFDLFLLLSFFKKYFIIGSIDRFCEL